MLLSLLRETARPPARAEEDGTIVLKLLAAPPARPSAVAAANAPAQAVTRKVAARTSRLRLKPAPVPERAPEVEQSPPPSVDTPEADDTPSSEADGGDVSRGNTLDNVEGGVVGGILGGVLGGVLSGRIPPPASLTPEERDAMVEHYADMLIRARFMRVRYPHLAAAAGIQGEVLLRVTISSQGRVLGVEQIGRCPHPVLCDSALELVRKADPFPPPPPELGNPFILELPFRYHLH